MEVHLERFVQGNELDSRVKKEEFSNWGGGGRKRGEFYSKKRRRKPLFENEKELTTAPDKREHTGEVSREGIQ